jgi:saccharopine dehydrogenase (NAD+, L-lysine-forming)
LQKKNIFVLGGYGGAGSSISHLLLHETECNVIIAGRNIAEALELSKDLNIEFPGRASGMYADASRPDTLEKALNDVDLLISAATTVDYVDIVAKTALHEGIDYLDIHYPQQSITILKKMARQIEAEGRTFITQCGFNPGLPSVLIRLAKSHFAKYEKARLGIAMNTRFEKGGALYEFIDSFSDIKADVYYKGKWRKAGLSDSLTFDFGHPFGKKKCYPISLEEMWSLPMTLGLDELGIYAAGLNWFVDYSVIPLAFLLGKVRKDLGREILASLMVYGLEKFSPADELVALLLLANGKSNSGPKKVVITISHNDAYYITAAPVVACIRQYLDNKIKPGLNIMGLAVDPGTLVKDMQRMGIEVKITEA